MRGKIRAVTALGLGLFLLAAAGFEPASAHDWYIDGAHGSDSGDGSSGHPFKTWQHLFFSVGLNPGDTAHFLPTTTYTNISLETSGTAAQPITITGDPNSLTQIEGDGSGEGFYVGANYVVVEYFNVLQAPGQHGGITVSSPSDGVIHHVTIAHNTVCNAGFAGISTIFADYITISHNTVCNNAKNTANGNTFASGISMWDDRDSDATTGTKMIVDGNIVYGNTNVPSCPTCQDTDGNGIIVDDNRNTQSGGAPYKGTTEITNNVVFGNGGDGIEAYSSDNVIVSGNTLYHNNQDPTLYTYYPGEIDLYYCGNIVATDNIAGSDAAPRSGGLGTDVSFSVQHCNGVTLARNLAYNDSNQSNLALFKRADKKVKQPKKFADLFGNPQFEAASLNPNTADFRIKPGSPAVGKGDPKLAHPPVDILGVARSNPFTLGAYENPGL